MVCLGMLLLYGDGVCYSVLVPEARIRSGDYVMSWVGCLDGRDTSVDSMGSSSLIIIRKMLYYISNNVHGQ